MKVVVITGAGSGIGAAVAKKYAETDRDGLRLVLIDINYDKLDETAAYCCGERGNLSKDHVVKLALDVTETANRVIIVNTTLEKFSQIDVLVNAAGLLIPGSTVTGVNDQDADKMMDVNVNAVYQLSIAFTPFLRQNGRASIVNISSVAGHRPSWNRLLYCMSKAALEQVTKCMALELGPFGVRVNSVAPGIIPTDLHSTRDTYESTRECGVHSYYECQEKRNPMGRNGTAGEVADSVLFLASEKASFINGHSLIVDGGLELVGPMLD